MERTLLSFHEEIKDLKNVVWGIRGENGMRSKVKALDERVRAMEQNWDRLKWTIATATLFVTFLQSKNVGQFLVEIGKRVAG